DLEHLSPGGRGATAGGGADLPVPGHVVANALAAAAWLARFSTNARSASTSSTTPTSPAAGVVRVKPTARAPSVTSACSTICRIRGSALLYTHAASVRA